MSKKAGKPTNDQKRLLNRMAKEVADGAEVGARYSGGLQSYVRGSWGVVVRRHPDLAPFGKQFGKAVQRKLQKRNVRAANKERVVEEV